MKEFTGNYLKCLGRRLGRIEQMLDSKIDERINRYQIGLVGEGFESQLDVRMTKLFSHAFENRVTPMVEKNFMKMFEQVNASFENGNKFYQDKLNIEQTKANHMRDTLNEIMKLYLQISSAVTQSTALNQSNFSRMQTVFQDKKIQITRMVDHLSDMVAKQQENQKRLGATGQGVIGNMIKLRDEVKSQVKVIEQKMHEEAKKRAKEGKADDSKKGKEIGRPEGSNEQEPMEGGQADKGNAHEAAEQLARIQQQLNMLSQLDFPQQTEVQKEQSDTTKARSEQPHTTQGLQVDDDASKNLINQYNNQLQQSVNRSQPQPTPSFDPIQALQNQLSGMLLKKETQSPEEQKEKEGSGTKVGSTTEKLQPSEQKKSSDTSKESADEKPFNFDESLKLLTRMNPNLGGDGGGALPPGL